MQVRSLILVNPQKEHVNLSLFSFSTSFNGSTTLVSSNQLDSICCSIQEN